MDESNGIGRRESSHLGATDSLLDRSGRADSDINAANSQSQPPANPRPSLRPSGAGYVSSTLDSGEGSSRREKGAINAHSRSCWRRAVQNIGYWRWEVLASFFSLACMATIIGLLTAFDGRSLHDWKMPTGITPNAAVSIFATLSKSAMLLVLGEGISHMKWIYFQQRNQRLLHMQTFDEASRGPWGALLLLKRIRWRASLAAGGALLVVFALAFDPFAQQVLSFPMRRVEDGTSVSAIPRAKSYDSGSATLPEAGGYGYPDPQGTPVSLFFGFQDAILQGVYAPGAQVKHMCPTGNCTWNTFETLAVCSRCKDVSQSLRRTCHMKTTVPVCGGSPPDVHCEYNTSQNCTYTFPNGATLNAGSTSSAWDGGVWVNRSNLAVYDRTQLAMTAMSNSRSSIYPPYTGSSPLIAANISSLYFTPNYAGNWTLPPAQGYQCEITWCVETHEKAASRNGILTDNPSKKQDLFFSQCVERPGHTQYLCPGFTPDRIPSVLKTSNQLSVDDYNNVFRNPDAWILSAADQSALYYELSSLLSTSYGYGNYSYLANTMARANSGNLSKTMDDIATSITLKVRQGPNSTAHNGTTYSSEAYIEVNWYWIVLPLALTLLSTAFLVACMLCQMDYGQGPWRSSSLAVLLHGLDRSPRTMRSLGTEERMDAHARGVKVRLKEDNDGHVALLQQ